MRWLCCLALVVLGLAVGCSSESATDKVMSTFPGMRVNIQNQSISGDFAQVEVLVRGSGNEDVSRLLWNTAFSQIKLLHVYHNGRVIQTTPTQYEADLRQYNQVRSNPFYMGTEAAPVIVGVQGVVILRKQSGEWIVQR